MIAARDLPVLKRPDRLAVVVVHGGSEAARYHDVMLALAAALRSGADGFEFDVRTTADGVLVVHHDENIGADPLRRLPYSVGERTASAIGYQLPRLEAVLEAARGRLRLDVEVKDAGYERALLQALGAAHWTPAQFVITSFDQRVLDAVHACDRDVVTGLLVCDVTGAAALELFRRSGASFLGPDHTMLDDATLDAAAVAGVPLLPWTLNERTPMVRLLGLETVVGVITDRPDEAIQLRRRA